MCTCARVCVCTKKSNPWLTAHARGWKIFGEQLLSASPISRELPEDSHLNFSLSLACFPARKNGGPENQRGKKGTAFFLPLPPWNKTCFFSSRGVLLDINLNYSPPRCRIFTTHLFWKKQDYFLTYTRGSEFIKADGTVKS